MAVMDFNPQGPLFQSGLDAIEKGYAGAVNGVAQEINRNKAEFFDYNRHIENGGSPSGERDDDGYLILPYDDELRLKIKSAEDTLIVLRKAYAITTYHHWERSALQWTGSKNSVKHDNLVKLVLKMGYPVDNELAKVRYLANLLKHGNDRWGVKLMQNWPELFPAGVSPCVGGSWPVSWHDCVALSDASILQILTIVRASGPKGILTPS